MAIIAAAIGLTTEVDAYYLGLALPSLLTIVLGNWVQLTFVGRYTTLLREARHEVALALRRRVGTIVVALGTAATIWWFFFPGTILSLLVDAAQLQQTSTALAVVSCTIVPVCLADFMGQTLNGHHRFAFASLAPLANALAATGLLWLWPEKNLSVMTWSLLLGAIIQLMIVAPAFLALEQKVEYDQRALRAESSALISRSLPVVPAILLSNAMLSVLQFSVSRLGEGAVAIMSYANRINTGISQLLVIGLSTVLLPFFASHLVKESREMHTRVFRQLSRGSAAAGCTVALCAYIFAEPVIKILFERGLFDADDSSLLAYIVLLYCLSILPLSLGTFIARYFSASGRTDLIAWSGFIGFTATVLTCVIAVNAQSLTLFACVPFISFTATLVFWLTRLANSCDTRKVVVDAWISLLRTSAVLAPFLLLDWFISGALLMLSPVVSLAIRILLLITGVIGLAYATGTIRWILKVNGSSNESRYETNH